jgi:tetratricopeptide (TPR) repeat protein
VRRLTTLAIIALCAVSAPPVRAQDGVQRGVRLFAERRYAEAKPLLAEAGEDARAQLYLGRIAALEGDFDEAVRRLERAARARGDATTYYWLGTAYAQLAQRGSRLRAMGPAKKGRAALERAVALDPRHIDARMALVHFYLVAPGVVGGSEAKGIAQAEEIARLDAYRGHIARGAVREDENDAAGAAREYEAAIRIHPDSAAAYYALGLLQQRARNTDDAFDAFERAARANEVETAALYAIGRLAATTGTRLDRGAEALRRYLATPPLEGSPPLSSAHFRLGSIYERTGRRDLARGEYEAALRIERRGEYRDALARVR